MKSKKIIIGSRGSKLALIYAKRAKEKILNFYPEVEIQKITTTGDINQKIDYLKLEVKDYFQNKLKMNY